MTNQNEDQTKNTESREKSEKQQWWNSSFALVVAIPSVVRIIGVRTVILVFLAPLAVSRNR